MKKIFAAILSVAIAATVFTVATTPEPVSAQAYTNITCEARSPYAYGFWTHPNGTFACQRALQQCAIRTPYGSTCYVTRWWYSY